MSLTRESSSAQTANMLVLIYNSEMIPFTNESQYYRIVGKAPAPVVPPVATHYCTDPSHGKIVRISTKPRVGYISKCAVDSEMLTVPDDEKPVAVFVYEIGDDTQAANYDVQA